MSRSFPIIVPAPIIVSGSRSSSGGGGNDNTLLNMIIDCSAIIIGCVGYIAFLERPRFQLKVVRKAAQIHVMARGINYPLASRMFHKNIDKLPCKGHTPVLPYYTVLEDSGWKTIYQINTTEPIESVIEECKGYKVHTEFQFAYNSFWLSREKLKSQKIYWHKNLQKELK